MGPNWLSVDIIASYYDIYFYLKLIILKEKFNPLIVHTIKTVTDVETFIGPLILYNKHILIISVNDNHDLSKERVF